VVADEHYVNALARHDALQLERLHHRLQLALVRLRQPVVRRQRQLAGVY
jgi:hypothetical protein